MPSPRPVLPGEALPPRPVRFPGPAPQLPALPVMSALFAHLPVQPRNDEQALALALLLGLTTSESARAVEYLRLADQIGEELHPAEVESIRDVVEICLNTLPLKS